MPYKDPEKQRLYQQKHYLDNKHLWQQRRTKRHKNCQEYANKEKSKIGCKCGEKNSACLDFHHKTPKNKTCTIAEAVQKRGIALVKSEVKKCSVLCANCHIKKHFTTNAKPDEKLNVSEIRNHKRKLYFDFKKDSICKECGEDDYRVLQFHHRDPNNKRFTISTRISEGTSIKLLFEEIAKCDVFCANCHRKHHAKK